MDIIKIDNLQKSYGQVKAVQGISFKVKEGELFAFLKPYMLKLFLSISPQ